MKELRSTKRLQHLTEDKEQQQVYQNTRKRSHKINHPRRILRSNYINQRKLSINEQTFSDEQAQYSQSLEADSSIQQRQARQQIFESDESEQISIYSESSQFQSAEQQENLQVESVARNRQTLVYRVRLNGVAIWMTKNNLIRMNPQAIISYYQQNICILNGN